MPPPSAPAARRTRAVESFKTAAECIGPVERGMALFAITRGQFSMLDALLHLLDQVGPAKLSLWTWAIAGYEVQTLSALSRDARVSCLDELRRDARITEGLLVIDAGAITKRTAGGAELIKNWIDQFGPASIRYVVNHAKLATIETADYKLLVRGSMNLNYNPRFEQLDVTEGGPDFDLVQRLERELPILAPDHSRSEAFQASKVSEDFELAQLAMFKKAKPWKK